MPFQVNFAGQTMKTVAWSHPHYARYNIQDPPTPPPINVVQSQLSQNTTPLTITVVSQDRWSFMAVVSQDRFHCISINQTSYKDSVCKRQKERKVLLKWRVLKSHTTTVSLIHILLKKSLNKNVEKCQEFVFMVRLLSF